MVARSISSRTESSAPRRALIVRTHWFSRTELLERQPRLRSPLVLRCVEDYLGGRLLPLDPVARLDLHSATSVSAVSI